MINRLIPAASPEQHRCVAIRSSSSSLFSNGTRHTLPAFRLQILILQDRPAFDEKSMGVVV